MKPHRVEKVASELRTLVSQMIRDHLQDPRVSSMTSITRVEVSHDLEWAKVYLSVYGQSGEQTRTLAALRHAGGHIQRLVAKELPIRQCPHLAFYLDESLEKSAKMMSLIDASMKELEQDQKRRDSARNQPESLSDQETAQRE